ncbi:MAG TPA: radical SAM protein [Thermodesulfobacteriota bacterium]|nr:radical SAM protein [Thermodesulfobacteriota bacterium]
MKKLKEHMIAGPAIKDFQFFIQWHLTERCNLHCRHCYQGRVKVREMASGEVKREIDGATRMFQAWEEEHGIGVSPSIHFTGGEPFLYRGLLDVIAYSKAKGYGVAMMTNGCLITKEKAQKAFDLGISDIQVSLEGPPELHDLIRGRGSFNEAAKGVERLVASGNRVSANVTLSRINVDHVEKTTEIAKSLGFYGIGFSRLVPCGRGKAFSDHFLTPQELKSAYQKIFSLNTPSFEVLSGDPLTGTLSGTNLPSGCNLTLSGCSAGFSGVTITSDGSVMPCRRIGLVAGNLKKKSLRAIWASSKLLWQLRRRESYKGKCGQCALWPSCRGCRAVAYAYSLTKGKPDLFADDPQCWVSD